MIYNSVSNILMAFNPKEWEELKNIHKQNIDINSKNQNPLFKNLIDKKFCIEKSVDELENVCDKLNKKLESLWNIGQIQITILPTLKCNMSCPYCFEGENKNARHISNDIEQSIIKFLKDSIKNPLTKSPIDHISIMWFGGEPLLNFITIERLTKQIIEICNTSNIKYGFKITTNGTLLTPQKWKEIERLEINDVQISLDGHRDMHNSKRPLKSRSIYNYDRILDNLKNRPKNIRVNVRINADKIVIKSLNHLINDLDKKDIWPNHADKVKLTLGMKYHTKTSKEPALNFFNDKEYYEAEDEFKNLQYEYYNQWAKINHKPLAKRKFLYPGDLEICYTARHPYGLTIDTDGNIYRCWMKINEKEFVVQNISAQYNVELKEHQKWMNYRKYYDNNECIECKFLPICEMDCIRQHFDDQIQCTGWRYLLIDRLTKQIDLVKKEPNCIAINLNNKIKIEL